MKSPGPYVLITPVYNEEELIEQVIQSVVAQTVPPKRWLIVDDGSSDKTGDIVAGYEREHEFITYHRLERNDVASYYSQRTKAFIAGHEKIKNHEHDYVAAVDADLTLPADYYESILAEFQKDPKLGVASGVYVDMIKGRSRKVVRSDISTAGGLQIFRRKCYEQIGGYTPLRHGGDDSLAEYKARMYGWRTQSFPKYKAIHHRPVGTRGKSSLLSARFRQGLTDYYLGTHALFMFAKSLHRSVRERPYMIGAVARLAGFHYGWLRHEKREISTEVLEYVRAEQLERLLSRTNGG